MENLAVFGAKYLFIASPIIAALFVVRQPRNDKISIALFGIVAIALTLAIAAIAGFLYDDPRPFVVGHFTPLISHVPDNGFPSDHTLVSGVVAAMVGRFNRKVAALLWLIVLGVGASRVYVGIHHAIDIAGSVLIALMGSVMADFILGRLTAWSILRRQRQPAPSPADNHP